MGVLKFQQWLRTEFRKHVSSRLSELIGDKGVKRLFVDYNAIVHMAATEVYDVDDPVIYDAMMQEPDAYILSEGGIVDVIMEELIGLIETVRPKRLVYIAADGVAMKAKIVQQRQRSFKSGSDTHPFNRNKVKPGTQFMTMVCSEIRSRLKQYAKENGDDTDVGEFPSKIEFSDDSDPGEGEHKIVKMFNKKPNQRRGFDREVDIVYSPDADMHFLMMLHSNPQSDNVVIMRHAFKQPPKEDDEEPQEQPKYEYFHTSEISKVLRKTGFPEIRDFLFVCIFGGNDFVPSLPCFKYGDGNVFGELVSAYRRTFGIDKGRGSIYDGDNIMWSNVVKYLQSLESVSQTFLERGGNKQIMRPDLYYDEKTGEDRRSKVLEWSMSDSEEGNAKFSQAFFNQRYKSYIFGTFHNRELGREDITYDLTPDMVRSYLEGFLWVMEYYSNQGQGVNHDWCYPFHYAPDVPDIKNYVETKGKKPDWYDVPLYKFNDVVNTPLQHLVAVLKQEDLYLLPDIVRVLFLKEMPHLFPSSVQTDRTCVPFGQEWREVILINYPSMASIRTLFEVIKDNPDVVAKNKRRIFTAVWEKKIRGV